MFKKGFGKKVVDRDQAAQHLAALGYQKGDTVYLRSFYPSDDPRKAGDKGRKAEAHSLNQLIQLATQFQAEGRGVYFVVNGGGHLDENVSNCRAIFYEHDNLHKDLQKELWRSLNLPEPSLQIDTGGKSIHSYWILEQSIRTEDWRQLQTDLLEYADGDRALKNPSRVMRLAGCFHFAPHNVPNGQSQIILNTGNCYSYSQLREIIPTQQAQEQEPGGNGKTSPPIPAPCSSPLYQCLTKDDRALIDDGAGAGERNNKGAKLARNLIGTANRLTYLGYDYEGDPRTLFDDYCDRCSPPLDSREAQSIWCSAEKSNPTAALTDDALLNCIKSWQRQNQVYSQQPQVNASVTGDSTVVGDSYNPDLVGIKEIVPSVTKILQSGLIDYEETQKLEEVASIPGIAKPAFKQLVSSIRSQIHDVQPEDEIRLDNLINWHNAQLDFDRALPSMATDLKHDANILNIEPIVIWQPLLAAVMSLAGKRVKLNVESHNVPAIAWTATVLESGGGKSRADNLVLTPLKQKQIEARKQFEQEVEAHQNWKGTETEEAPPKPVERKYTFEVATIQAVIKRLSEQKENGVIWARDELAGLFKSFGQFGKGVENEGLECLLKLWDGSPAQVDRVFQGDGFMVEETALSLTGGIQPGVFRKIFRDPDDSQGMLARFLVANPQALMPKRVKGYCHLSEKLPHLYDWLEHCQTGIIKLSSAADNYYTKLCEIIGQQAWSTTQPAIRAWMFKLPTQLLRIALALHLIECYHDSNRDYWHLQKDTLERAVLFAQYYRSAFNVLQETTTENEDISSILLKIWDAAITKHQDGISTRDAYRSIKAIQNLAKQAFRDVSAYTTELFGRLEQMGKGQIIKLGRQIKFVANLTPNNPPPQPDLEFSHSGDSVPIPQKPEIQATAPSPPTQVSPVTNPDHHNCLSKANVVVETTQYSQVVDNTQNSLPVVETDRGTGFVQPSNTNNCECDSPLPQPTPEITPGARVRVCFPGSVRHEKEGIVTKLVYKYGIKMAVVLLENMESKFKEFLCPIPGSDLTHLELI
ncbi:DUF3987 domain-containing protein [Nodularia chucula]|uniref:DUF3987 domain-containing protein n=1 Tax=Nodularia chucula TaxID=3093667 RepID=UPI0039C67428